MTSERTTDNMSEGGEKSVKLPTFDGSREGFHVWWTRFTAYALYYKFGSCLKPTAEAHLPTKEEEDSNDTNEQKAARRRNILAVFNLTLAFKTNGLLGMINKAKTTNWPSGKAHKIVEALYRKYRPDDLVARAELRKALALLQMKRTEDPTNLFEKISTIENTYASTQITISQDDLLAVVLDKAPKEYAAVITAEARNKGAALTMADVEEAMFAHWRIAYGTGKSAEEKEHPIGENIGDSR